MDKLIAHLQKTIDDIQDKYDKKGLTERQADNLYKTYQSFKDMIYNIVGDII